MRLLPAYSVYCAYCLVVAALRYAYWTAAVYFYISVVGLGPFRLVLVGTTVMVVILLGEVPTGVVADVYGRRLSVIVGVALMGAGFAFDGWRAAFWATLLAQVVWGLGATFTSGALTAWITDELRGADLARVYLRGAQWGSAGSVLGVALGVALSYAGLAFAMIAAGLGLVAFAAVLVVVMPECHFRPAPQGARSRREHALATLREGAAVVRGSATLGCFVGVVVFHGMASESFDRLWEIHLLRIGLPAGLTPVAWFGLLQAGGLLLSIAAGEVLRRRVAGGAEPTLLRWLVVLTALLTVGMAAFGLAPGFAAAVAAFWGTLLLRQIVPPLVDAWVNRHIPSDVRATVLSLAGQADALGQIAGGPLFGWLASAHGTGLALVAAGLTLLPGIPLLRRAAARAGR